MATAPVLPLSALCAVSVSVTPAGVAVPSFNQGLIIGTSGRIPSVGANSRLRQYANLAAMVSDGFETTDPEYIAASLYFGQNSGPVTPPLFVWIGAQDLTAIAALTLGSAPGTGYAIGDVFLVTQGGASFGYGKVTAATAGVPTAVAIIPGQQGTAYTEANNLATVAQAPSTGTGLEVDITALGETPLQAVTACRNAQTGWYEVQVCGSTDSDNEAIVAYAQTATPAMQVKYGTTSLSALQGTTGNIFSVIKAASYSRGHGIYSTAQGGAAPNNIYAGAAVMGVCMGLNTGLANSNFTPAAKTLVGITAEPISLAQMGVFAGVPGQNFGNNGNVFGNWGNVYPFYYQGINGNGMPYMTVLGLDMLAADIQLSILNVLQAMRSLPQTNPGQGLVLNAARGACVRSGVRGFIAGAVWNGPAISLGGNNQLLPGTALPNGFWISSPSFTTQSSADRALLKGMPVYVAVTLAGSQQSFIVGVNVQQ